MDELTHKSLFELIDSSRYNVSSCSSIEVQTFLFNHVCECAHIEKDKIDKDVERQLRNRIATFTTNLLRRWRKASYNKDAFLKKYSQWLGTAFPLSVPVQRKSQEAGPSGSNIGRPKKDFQELSHREKLRKTLEIRKSASADELAFSATSKLYEDGERAAAEVLKEATQSSPTRPLKMRRILTEAKLGLGEVVPYSPDEAVALMVDARLTKDTYQQIRRGALNRKADLYPSYDRVLEAKKKCYPENIQVNERGASVPLQDLLNHTCSRLIGTLDIPEDVDLMELHGKWGCDGSSGFNEYMQRQPEDSTVAENSVFLFSFVPLCLIASTGPGEVLVDLYRNKTPSSNKTCRPIKIVFVKETKETTREEFGKTNKELMQVKPFDAIVNGKTVPVIFTLQSTMVDGKVVSSLSGAAPQNCGLCGATPKVMNNIGKALSTNLKSENFKFGLSSLHALLNCFEHCKKLSFNLELKATSIRGATAQQLERLEQRKGQVKEALRKELGIVVDRVVQGKGTSNTGNVARKFFQNPCKAANATGLDITYLRRISNILQVLSSGKPVDTDAFRVYTLDTAKLYIKLYDWYWMPVTVHKILLHGAEVIKHFLLPPGMLSEDAQEARNKDCRRLREHHTRKFSRIETTRDLFHGLLVSSDPVITSLRKNKRTDRMQLSEDAKAMLLSSEDSEEEYASSEDERGSELEDEPEDATATDSYFDTDSEEMIEH